MSDLLREALEIDLARKTAKRSNRYNEAQLKLARAWAKGTITSAAVGRVLGQKYQTTTSLWLLGACRELVVRQGNPRTRTTTVETDTPVITSDNGSSN